MSEIKGTPLFSVENVLQIAFISLTNLLLGFPSKATTKPHHKVQASGVVLGYSHMGMLAAARWLMKQVAPQVREAMEQNQGYRLCLVGEWKGPPEATFRGDCIDFCHANGLLMRSTDHPQMGVATALAHKREHNLDG